MENHCPQRRREGEGVCSAYGMHPSDRTGRDDAGYLGFSGDKTDFLMNRE
ncbi:MAG: hypothetical protein JKX84_01485 [Flavobacteriales bacterium]|nr:hypothetical protein [Flavobacteriales bacterium]